MVAVSDNGILVRVVAPHFCCGIIFDRKTGACVEAAPILSWCVGKQARYLRSYFDRKGWEAERV